MVKMQFDIDKEENRIVTIIKGYYNLKDKKQAVKKIIMEYGKRMKIKFE